MIRKVSITNHTGDAVTIDLYQPLESGFLVRDISGLGPMKADIHMTELATTDGSIFNSSRATYRNIVLSLEFMSNHKTIEEVRLDSYKYFPVKRPITIMVETDSRIADILGYVETNEPDIFSENEGCQVSIICPDPYFKKFGMNRTIFSGVDPKFHFPFQNNDPVKKLINFGEIYARQEAPVINDGDEDVGVIIKIHAKNEVRNITVWNVTMAQTMSIDDSKLQALTGSMIHQGDDIVIDTSNTKKTAILKRRGRRINILNCLKRPLSWIKLQRGLNVLYYDADVGKLQMDFEIEYKILYEGM